jgi:type II secretory pathway component PulF
MLQRLIDGVLDTYRRSRFTSTDRSSFYSKLGLLMKNGLSLEKSLNTLLRVFSERGKKPNRIKAVVTEECLQWQARGQELSLTLLAWVPYEEAATIAAGAQSTEALHEALQRAKKIVRRKAEMRKVLVKSLSYPAVLWIAMGGLLYFVSKTAMPQLVKMTKPADWDTTAQIMSVMSNIVGDHGVLLLCSLAAIVGCVVWSTRHTTGIVRVYLDRVPPWSILRMIAGATFMYNFGVLQASGMKALDVLEQERKHATPYMLERIDGAIMGVTNGKNIGEALQLSGHEFPSSEAIEYLTVIASLNGGPEQMMEFAEDWMAESLEEVEAIAAVLANLSIVAIFGVMGFILSGASSIGLNALGTVGQ